MQSHAAPDLPANHIGTCDCKWVCRFCLVHLYIYTFIHLCICALRRSTIMEQLGLVDTVASGWVIMIITARVYCLLCIQSRHQAEWMSDLQRRC